MRDTTRRASIQLLKLPSDFSIIPNTFSTIPLFPSRWIDSPLFKQVLLEHSWQHPHQLFVLLLVFSLRGVLIWFGFLFCF